MMGIITSGEPLVFFFICLGAIGGIFFGFHALLSRAKTLPTLDEAMEQVDADNKVKVPKNLERVQTEALAFMADAVFLGTYGNQSVYIPNNTSHVFACGTTGSGKTVALSNFFKSGFENDMPMLIVDGKGDLGANSIIDIIHKMKGNKKVYVVDINNPATSDKYNPFKDTSPTVIKDMIINLSVWSEEHYKQNTERYLQRLIELLNLSKIPLSLHSITNNMAVDKFTMLSANLSKADVITKEEHLHNMDIAKVCGSIAESASARFTNLIENEIGVIFSDDGIDIYTAIKENAVTVFILNPLLYPELSNAFGKLLIIDSKKAVAKLYGSGIERIFFIFDEINVYASKSLLDLVNKSRSANITCILATQSLSDLSASVEDGEHFKQQVIENCNNYILVRQNSAINAEEWAAIIGTRQSMEVTYALETEQGHTGRGSARQTREFILHPDDIKNFKRGEGFYVSKDKNIKTKIEINMPF